MKISKNILKLIICAFLWQISDAQNYSWAPVGPAPQSSKDFGPVSGRVWGISISPAYTSAGIDYPAMMFIAVDQGGIWRSKNFTSATPDWEPLSDKLPNLKYAESITVDPRKPNRLLVPSGQQMILVSENSGDSWDILANNVFGSSGPGLKILFDPTDGSGNTMYGVDGDFSGGSSIFKTTDGGATWKKLSFPVNRTISGLEYTLSQNNNLILYAGMSSSGIWQSIDAGQTWNKMTIQLRDITSQVNVDDSKIGAISLTADRRPGTTNGIYAFITNSSSQQILNIFKLINNTWSPIANNLTSADDYNSVHGTHSSSGFQACGISEMGMLYAAAGDPQWSPIYQTNNSGAKWNSIESGTNGFRPHTDIHCFVFYSGKVYAATDGGIYRFNPLDNTRAGRNNWESLNTNSLQTILINGIGIHPTNPDIILCGSQDNGIGLLGKGVWDGTFGGDNSKILFESAPSGNEVYAFTTGVDDYRFLFLSKDGGKTWNDNSPPDARSSEANVGTYAPFAKHPTNPSRIVVGIDRIYESFDKGITWGNPKSAIFNPTSNRPSGKPIGSPATAITYGNNDVIWVAYMGRLFRTTNDGGNGDLSNWANMNNGVNFGGSIIGIVVDPQRASNVYLVVSNNTIWKYQIYFGKGTNSWGWANITSNLPNSVSLKTLLLIPSSAGILKTLFVGTSAGAYMSSDDGNSWQPFDNGLPMGWVQDIQYFSPQSILYAGLYGRGIYRTSLKDVLDRDKRTDIVINVPKTRDCELGAVEGETYKIDYTVKNPQNNPVVSVKWTIQGATTSVGETFDGRDILVTIPLNSSEFGVGIDVEFSNGLKIGKYVQVTTHTQEDAATFRFFCNLKNESRLKPIPWWRWNPLLYTWDPKTNEFLRNKVSKEALIDMEKQTQALLLQLRNDIERYR